jgi:CheY-like chemotaxis protein
MENEPETALTLLKCVPGQGERILVVDDEEQILDMIELMLQSLNYTVVTKSDSIEALEEFRKDPEFYDLVITDQTMPGLTGFELSKKILAIRKGTPIILCTGFSELVNEELVKTAGIRKFILKPISKSQLALYLREILDADKIGR